MRNSHEHKSGDSCPPAELTNEMSVHNAAPSIANVDELVTPARLLELTGLTDVEVERSGKNISILQRQINTFDLVLKETVRGPLQRFLDVTTNGVLSWKQCMEIFEIRRNLSNGVMDLALDLRNWTYQERAPLLCRYMSEVEKYTLPLYDQTKGVFRLVELSTDAGWALQLKGAMANLDEAVGVTEELLALLARGEEEVNEELAKRGLSPEGQG